MVPSGESVLPCIKTTPMVCAETGAAMPIHATSVSNSRLMSDLPRPNQTDRTRPVRFGLA